MDFITYFDLLDFPAGTHQATYSHPAEIINPKLGVSGITDSSFFDIPKPNLPTTLATGAVRSPSAEFDLLQAAGKQKFLIYNGTIDSMKYLVQQSLAGDKTSTSIRIFFKANAATVIMAWSGHIAARRNWGTGNSAQSVSGSPYHTRLLSLNGSGGNQDRALAAAAVRVPPECLINAVDPVCVQADSIVICFNGTTTGKTFLWSLVGGKNGASTQISGSATGSCVTLKPSGSDFVADSSVTVNLAVTEDGATTNCQQTVSILAKPATPTFTVNEATLCGTLTKPEVVVCNPLPNASYRLIQGSYDSTKTTGDPAGVVKFVGLSAGADIKLVVVDSNGCVSDTADCDQKVTTCPALTSQEKNTTRDAVTESSVVRTPVSQAFRSVKELQVQAYPNPYFSSVNFQLLSPTSGKATLEVYDLAGRKLALINLGHIDAGIEKSINYKIPANQRMPLIYKLSVGNNFSRGKLLPNTQEP